MKKSLLIIATLFLVPFGFSQNHSGKPISKNGIHGNHGNYGQHNTHGNSNTHYNGHNPHSNVCCSVNYGHQPHNNGNHYGKHFMSSQELNSIVNAIRNEAFSSDKLAIARQAVMFQNVRANQVAEIGNLFSFESDRLDFAKMAYKNTVDKQNYYLVNSIFRFSSSKRELNDYIYK